MSRREPPRRGRGAGLSPDPRYLGERREAFDDGWTPDEAASAPPATRVDIEQARSILSTNDSPDIPFEQSINPYRGCEHGCVYCYARPSHAYLDLSPGLDFETRIFAKANAAELLRQALARPGYRPRVIALGANTDPYQPVERTQRITRGILEVLAEHRHPVTVVTKSAMVERDLDLLAPMGAAGLAEVHLSVTTLDRRLARRLEPRATAPQRRLAALASLAAAGVPAGVMFAPVIPALNDHDLEAVLEAAAGAGARRAGYVMLRLPHEVGTLFRQWLADHEPLKAQRVMNRINDVRGGRDNDPRFGSRLAGEGVFAELVRRRFEQACARLGLDTGPGRLDCGQFQRPVLPGGQLELW